MQGGRIKKKKEGEKWEVARDEKEIGSVGENGKRKIRKRGRKQGRVSNPIT